MKAWPLFFYGLTVGLVAGALVVVGSEDPPAGWLLLGAAAALAVGVVTHMRAVRAEKGRRWRKTSPPWEE